MNTLNLLTKETIAQAVYEAIPQTACVLPADVRDALVRARGLEGPSRGAIVLDQLLENADIAEADRVPICQDTGTTWVCLEIGPDVLLPGDAFSLVNDAVARAYTEANLRKSVVKDALVDRSNTGDNTPAFVDVEFVDTPGARVHVLLKGGGSDNASRVVMLTPGAGREGIVREVMDCVRHKAANACPPLVIGIGVGGTFDKVAHLAKTALLRPVGCASENSEVAAFERELLDMVNATGMGPGALGGKTLALDVHVNTAPCHIAALPLAINMGCSAMRRMTIELETTPVGGVR
ncbi:fumarate hydratase [Slackia heliotrinireducens]|uniref:fumarate hydratase n=1 Tax=Slackia heliotrinireducens TaxID=84110 RepID=UPI0033145438